jgi:hypothetical protein
MSLKCGNQNCFKKGIKLCGNCKLISYCSVECQRIDWKKHKNTCKKCSVCYEILSDDAVLCPCEGTRVCPSCLELTECVKKPIIPQFETNDSCVVCLEKKDKYTGLPCGHKVCPSCWKGVESDDGQCCPICRRFINTTVGAQKKTMKSSNFLKVLELTKKMIKYCIKSSKFIGIPEEPGDTSQLIHSFVSGMIQHSSPVELSTEEELIQLEIIYDKIIKDEQAIYYGLFKKWIHEFGRDSIPTSKSRHLILSILPEIMGDTPEIRKRAGGAIWKMWMLDLSLRN